MNPLCFDAMIIGPVVELRYSSHTEAFQQLYALRRALDTNAQLLAALREAECALSLMQSYGHCAGDETGRDAAQCRAIYALNTVGAAIAKATS